MAALGGVRWGRLAWPGPGSLRGKRFTKGSGEAGGHRASAGQVPAAGLPGAAVAAVSSKVMNSGHKKASHMRKSAGKAMHSVGNLIGDVEKMLR